MNERQGFFSVKEQQAVDSVVADLPEAVQQQHHELQETLDFVVLQKEGLANPGGRITIFDTAVMHAQEAVTDAQNAIHMVGRSSDVSATDAWNMFRSKITDSQYQPPLFFSWIKLLGSTDDPKTQGLQTNLQQAQERLPLTQANAEKGKALTEKAYRAGNAEQEGKIAEARKEFTTFVERIVAMDDSLEKAKKYVEAFPDRLNNISRRIAENRIKKGNGLKDFSPFYVEVRGVSSTHLRQLEKEHPWIMGGEPTQEQFERLPAEIKNAWRGNLQRSIQESLRREQ